MIAGIEIYRGQNGQGFFTLFNKQFMHYEDKAQHVCAKCKMIERLRERDRDRQIERERDRERERARERERERERVKKIIFIDVRYGCNTAKEG